jgi:hypothetical protein
MVRRPSLKRALGVTKTKRDFARLTGIPTSRSGRKRKARRELEKAAGCCIPLAFLGLFIGSAVVLWQLI